MDSTVVVTGVGREAVVPDVVHLGLGVEVSRPTPADALSAAAGALRELHAVLDAAGVPPTARQTSGTTVNPAWEHDRHTGHVAHAGLQVRLDDVEAAGDLVQLVAAAAGEALQVRSLELGTGDLGDASARARAAAVRDARGRAGQIAEAAGLRLGAVVSLVEGGSAGHGVGPAMVLESAGGPPVSAGEGAVVVQVTGTWLLEP